ncbi:rhodanese-like domain-containing protein [Aurantiacibacter gilvus]|uniref:Rhodanese-like domain-containing protein n=1 Tax=Aurantiacibacter gilvus TaxID=3139141 RepID=A0ABU9IAM5_9SPHN
MPRTRWNITATAASCTTCCASSLRNPSGARLAQLPYAPCLPGAIPMPVETFDPAAVPLGDGRETVLCCRVGNRSDRATATLADLTGDTVRHLEGGITAWVADGQDATASPQVE